MEHLSERQLCTKLLTKFHLSVPERGALPGEIARFSVLVEVVRGALHANGWFPFPLVAGRDIGEGAVLEQRSDGIWVHEQHEVGVSRYSAIASRAVGTVSDAVRAYVAAIGGPPIDGVRIDWEA